MTPAPGPDPSLSDPRLAALVQGAFRAFLHRGHERALRLPDRWFAWLVSHLIHFATAGLYGLPPPPVPESELTEALARLVSRFAAAARRRPGEEEGEEGPATALQALERQLVEKAVRESRALFQHQQQHCGARVGAGAGAAVGGGGGEAPPRKRASSSTAAAAAEAEEEEREEREREGQDLSLVDRIARLDAPRKCFLDFLAPRDLAAVQQARSPHVFLSVCLFTVGVDVDVCLPHCV